MLHLWTPLGAMQDLLRIQLVQNGVDTIHQLHPDGPGILYPFVFAACKSSGFLFIKYAEQVSLRGSLLARPLALPNAATKTCVLCALAMAANAAGAVSVDRHLLLFSFAAAMILLRLAGAVVAADPFCGAETVLCGIAFGYPEQQQDGEETKTVGEKVAKVFAHSYPMWFDVTIMYNYVCRYVHYSAEYVASVL